MTEACRRVMDALPRGELPPELRAHAGGCPRCQAAVEAYRALAQDLAPTSPDRPPLRLRPEVAAELAATARPAAPWWAWPLFLGAVNALVALVGMVAMAGDGYLHNRAHPAALAAVAVLITACALAGTFFATAPGFGGARRVVGGVSLITAAAVALGGSGDPGTRSLLVGGLPCLGVETAMTAVPLLAAVWIQRRFAFDPARSLLACLSAGAAGLFALHFHCAIGTLQHLFAFHVLPWVALGALGLYARARMPSRSYAP